MAAYQIQRLSFGEKLDQSFRLLRDHFVPLTVPFLVAYLPLNLLALAFGLDKPDPAHPFGKLGLSLLLALLMLATAPLAQLVVNVVVADAYLGHPTSVGAAFKRASPMFLGYIGTTMLVGIALVLWSMLLLIPGIYFAVMWSLIGPIVVVEQLYGSKAMQRSRALVKGHFWPTFALAIVVGLVVTVLNSALSFAFKFIPVFGTILTTVIGSVGTGFSAAVIVVLYVDLRCRHEDFDLQLLARQISASGSLPPPAPSSTNAAAG